MSSDYQGDNLAEVKLNGKSGFLNKKGIEVLPPKYDLVNKFKNDIAIVGIKAYEYYYKYGLINMKGNEITPIKYKSIYDTENGYFQVCLDDKCGLANRQGKEIIPIQYSGVSSPRYGFFIVRIGEKYGIVTQSNKEIVPCKFDDIFIETDNIITVKLDNKFGLYNGKGRELFAPIYTSLSYDKNVEKVRIDIDGKTNYYDLDSKASNSVKYDYIGAFYKGVASIELKGKKGFVDENFNETVPPIYDEITFIKEDLHIVKLNGKYGIISDKGTVVVPVVYNEMTSKTIFTKDASGKNTVDYAHLIDYRYGEIVFEYGEKLEQREAKEKADKEREEKELAIKKARQEDGKEKITLLQA